MGYSRVGPFESDTHMDASGNLQTKSAYEGKTYANTVTRNPNTRVSYGNSNSMYKSIHNNRLYQSDGN